MKKEKNDNKKPEIDKELIYEVPAKKNIHPNELINAKQDFALVERRILLLVLNQYFLHGLNEDIHGNLLFDFSMKDLGKLKYKHVRKALSDITGKKIYNYNKYSTKKNKEEETVLFIYNAMYNGRFSIVLNKMALPLFKNLKINGYTVYHLEAMLSLSTVFSQRIYEILLGIKNQNKTTFTISIKDLLYKLALDKIKTYRGPRAAGDLKRKILIPVQQELRGLKKKPLKKKLKGLGKILVLEELNGLEKIPVQEEKKENEIKLDFDFKFIKKNGKSDSIEFTIIDKDKAVKRAKTTAVVTKLASLSPDEKQRDFNSAIKDYTGLKSSVIEKIRRNPIFLNTFLKLHLKIYHGLAKPNTTKEAYLMGTLKRDPRWKDRVGEGEIQFPKG